MKLYIDTKFSNDTDCPKFLNFHTTASEELGSNGTKAKKVGNLSGFIADISLGEWIEDLALYDFDERSENAFEAYIILKDELEKIAAILRIHTGELATFDSIILLENNDVDKAFRGHGLALRLMRELASMFMSINALFILKAHPTQTKVASNQDCRKLAAYYGSDTA